MESRLFQPCSPLYGFLPLIAFQSGKAVNPALTGTGVADVAAAKLAYDRARASGLGVEMEW